MRKVFLSLAGFAVLGLLLSAAEPLATVSSSEPFKLRGVAVPTAGIRSWPLLAGDDILTAGAPAVVLFRDGSRVTLAGSSRAKLETVSDRVNFRLLDGSMQFRLSRDSRVRIYSRDTYRPGAAGTVTAGAAPRTVSRSRDSGGIRTQALPPISRTR